MYLDGLGRTTDGDILGQWKKSNHNNQQWSLSIVETSANARGSSFVIEAKRESNPDESKFDSYPNPFVTDFTLDVRNSGEPFQIVLFDATGKVMETITHSETSGPLSLGGALKPGLYLVRVNGVNWSQSFKVLKE
jgi:hypothetical protein